MTTTAGGVAITLDRADTVHILDETWVPDDQEQFEDRAHRASRMHQVTVYYYRSKDTVEEDIYKLVQDNPGRRSTVEILDIRSRPTRTRASATGKIQGYSYGESRRKKNLYIQFIEAIDVLAADPDNEAAWLAVDAYRNYNAGLHEK
jgi:hypothetical protein